MHFKIGTEIKALILVILLFLTSCNPLADLSNLTHSEDGKPRDVIDQAGRLTRQDYKDFLMPKEDKEYKKQIAEPAIPEIYDIITAPQPPDIAGDKLVSLSVTEEVPLKDVLIELSRLADVDIEIDAGISGGIIFSVKDRPFKQVIERIVLLGNLRAIYHDGILRIERDLPYQVNYYVDFLNIVRSNSGSIDVDTSVLSSQGESEGLSSGSTNALSSSYNGHLWTAIEASIANILQHSAPSLAANNDTETTTESSPQSYSVNRQAGVITILASERIHEAVEDYLNLVKESVTSQVMIEAKILEVTLNEEYRTGINFGDLSDSNLGLSTGGGWNFPFPDSSSTNTSNTFKLSLNTNITSAITALENFGVTRTLSSPRITALNNQQAVLTFARNQVYFEVEVEETTEDNTDTGGGTTSTVSVDSTLNSVPIGIILTLQPSIDLKTNEVTMNVRPTLSTSNETIKDPGVDIQVQQINLDRIAAGEDELTGVGSDIPIVEVREMDTVMRLKSGQVMVIGGLMTENTRNTDTGVPFVSKIPFIGNLTKSVEKVTDVVETVIFLKATIIPPSGTITKQDKRFYKTFSRDTHPLTF